MKTIAQLQNEIAQLIAQANTLSEQVQQHSSGNGMYMFTENELALLVNAIMQDCQLRAQRCIACSDYDAADNCTIDWSVYGNTCEAEIQCDNDEVRSEYESEISIATLSPDGCIDLAKRLMHELQCDNNTLFNSTIAIHNDND